MKRNIGFTLIELVTVIIILAILLVAAAPKLIYFTSDAHKSTLLSVKAAIQATNNFVHSKSRIIGNHRLPYSVKGTPVVNTSEAAINLSYGFIVASQDVVSKAFNFEKKVFGVVQGAVPEDPYGGTVFIYIKSRTPFDNAGGDVIDQVQSAQCYLIYSSATSSEQPTYFISSDGC